jgi:hypothetical protein
VYHALLLNLWLKDTEKRALFKWAMLFEAFDLNSSEKGLNQSINEFVFMLYVTT